MGWGGVENRRLGWRLRAAVFRCVSAGMILCFAALELERGGAGAVRWVGLGCAVLCWTGGDEKRKTIP